MGLRFAQVADGPRTFPTRKSENAPAQAIPTVCLDLWAVGRWHIKPDELEQRVRAVWAERSVPIRGEILALPTPAERMDDLIALLA